MATREATTGQPVRRRRQQRTVETRLKIVKAAMAAFASLGFDGASTRGIAEAADVPHSLVIYHFTTKQDLWHETVREAVGWYAGREFGVVGPVPQDDPVGRLKRNFAHYIRFSAEHPDFFRMLTHENRLESDRLDWLVKHHAGPTAAHLTELIRMAQAQGGFVEGDPLTLLYVFLGAATSPYRSAREIQLITGKATNSPQAVEAHIALVEKLFFRSPRTMTPGQVRR